MKYRFLLLAVILSGCQDIDVILTFRGIAVILILFVAFVMVGMVLSRAAGIYWDTYKDK